MILGNSARQPTQATPCSILESALGPKGVHPANQAAHLSYVRACANENKIANIYLKFC